MTMIEISTVTMIAFPTAGWPDGHSHLECQAACARSHRVCVCVASSTREVRLQRTATRGPFPKYTVKCTSLCTCLHTRNIHKRQVHFQPLDW